MDKRSCRWPLQNSPGKTARLPVSASSLSRSVDLPWQLRSIGIHVRTWPCSRLRTDFVFPVRQSEARSLRNSGDGSKGSVRLGRQRVQPGLFHLAPAPQVDAYPAGHRAQVGTRIHRAGEAVRGRLEQQAQNTSGAMPAASAALPRRLCSQPLSQPYHLQPG